MRLDSRNLPYDEGGGQREGGTFAAHGATLQHTFPVINSSQ